MGPPSDDLVDYQLEKGGMPLDNAVGVNSKKELGATLKIKAQVLSIWAKGCMLDDCACVI